MKKSTRFSRLLAPLIGPYVVKTTNVSVSHSCVARDFMETHGAALLAALRLARYEINFCLVKITIQLSIQTLAACAKTNAFTDSFRLLWRVFWVDVDQFGDEEMRILTFSLWFVIIVVDIFFK